MKSQTVNTARRDTGAGRSPWRIQSRLLVTVNAAMAVLVGAFLLVDYQREVAERLAQKQIALEEEAKTLLPAVARLRDDGVSTLQEYVDDVCGRIRDAHSPGHHIVVRTGNAVVQSTAHGRASPELARAVELADASPANRAEFADQELLVGSARLGSITVYVSEDVNELRHSVFGHVLWRLAAVAALGVAAAVVASVALVRIVTRPLNRLVSTVREIRDGNLAVRSDGFQSAELTSLSSAINSMSASLEAAERVRFQELLKARQIQEHLLPREVEVPELAVSALYRPATQIAGDYYDIVRLPDESWLTCIADVCGHGVPAAMTAAMLKAFLLHAAEHHSEPHEILSFINERFMASSPEEMFASMLLLRWSANASSFQYASAGHEPAWQISGTGELHTLGATGLFLGLATDSTWTSKSVRVESGDKLLLFTDGACETFNAEGEMFGRDRLKHLLSQHGDARLEELIRQIDTALAAHRDGKPSMDDMTVVAIEFLGCRLPTTPSRSRRTHCLTGA